MSEDQPGNQTEKRARRGWLARISKKFNAEPKGKKALLELLESARRSNLLDSDAYLMMSGVLSVSDIRVHEIMVPRSQMVVIERDAPLGELLPTIIKSAHSRFPVTGENKDEVLGLLLAKDLLHLITENSRHFSIRDLLRPVQIIPEYKRLDTLLKEFRSSRSHMAVVVDEYGGISGLVTIEDILEEIVGEIEDEHDVHDESDIVEVGNGSYRVQALTPIREFDEFFGSKLLSEEYDTIGGLVNSSFGHMPRRGEELIIGEWQFRVLRADNRRLHLISVTRIDPDQPDTP